MRRKSEIMNIAGGLQANLAESFKIIATNKAAEAKTVVAGTYDEAHDAAESIKNSVDVITRGTDFEGVFVNPFLSSFKSFEEGGKLSHIELTIKSKLKATFAYHATYVIVADEHFIENICNAYIDSMIQHFYVEEAGANITALNDLITKVCADNNIPITFGFTIEDSKNYVTAIDDQKVVFNARVDEAIELRKSALFQEGDEYANMVREKAITNLIDNLKAVHTTPQIIKSGIEIIKTLTGVRTKKRAERLIRGTYHKQAIHFNKVNSGTGYHEVTTTVDGEEVELFSLLEKTADGEIKVILAPFNVKTLFTVDFDVIADVKAKMVPAKN